MPNWCEGSIKIRGTKDDILTFLSDGLNKYGYDYEKMESVLKPKNHLFTNVYGDCTEVTVEGEVYIEGTRRAFINYLNGYLYDGEENIVIGEFMQAWSIDEADFDALKDKWNVDFRLYGTDCGMEFSKEVVAERGKPTQSNCIEYNDFRWECPFPNMGG